MSARQSGRVRSAVKIGAKPKRSLTSLAGVLEKANAQKVEPGCHRRLDMPSVGGPSVGDGNVRVHQRRRRFRLPLSLFFQGGNIPGPGGVVVSHSANFDHVTFGSSDILLVSPGCLFLDTCFDATFLEDGIFQKTGAFFASDGDAKIVIADSSDRRRGSRAFDVGSCDMNNWRRNRQGQENPNGTIRPPVAAPRRV